MKDTTTGNFYSEIWYLSSAHQYIAGVHSGTQYIAIVTGFGPRGSCVSRTNRIPRRFEKTTDRQKGQLNLGEQPLVMLRFAKRF